MVSPINVHDAMTLPQLMDHSLSPFLVFAFVVFYVPYLPLEDPHDSFGWILSFDFIFIC